MVHGRISTRLPDFEYRGGVYHVVICTSDRESFLGEIINHEMCCNELGLYVEKCLQTVPYHLSYAHVPFFQVMPNHVHALVRIDTNLFSRPIGATGVACCAPTNAPSGVKDTPQIGHEGEEKHLILEPFDYNVGNYAKEITPQKGQLGTVIRSIKSAVTHWANQQQIPFKWQRNFYDHIIRSSHELMAMISYIEQNPANWEEDLYNV